MKNTMCGMCVLLATTGLPVLSVQAANSAVVYFSRAENTDIRAAKADGLSAASLSTDESRSATGLLAQQIAVSLGVPAVSLRTQLTYPPGFDETVRLNRSAEWRKEVAALKEIPDLSGHSEVFIGFPVWSMSLPPATEEFLQSADLKGKSIRLFCTHDGYGEGGTLRRVREILGESHVEGPVLAVSSDSLSQVPEAVSSWLEQIRPGIVTTGSDITARVDGEVIRIRLNNSPEAQAFRRMLPVRVTMGEYGGREFYGPFHLSIPVTSEGRYTFEDGAFTWCPTNNTVAVFYNQSSQPTLSMAVYPIGRVVSDLEVFRRLKRSAVFEFSE